MNRTIPEYQRYAFHYCDGSYNDSEVVIFGAPYDGTTSNRPGTRFAPAAIRMESPGIESYSPYLDMDLCDGVYFDAGDISVATGDSELVLDEIESFVSGVVRDDKIPFMLGGEHLVTLGAVRAVAKKFPDLHIVHFDAHADLRDEFLGVKLSHACVLRRCHELVGDGRIFQFGIRSGDRDELRWGRDKISTRFFDFETLEDTVEHLRDKPVYFTLDLDVLDPSCLPGTGTPEAGGVSFKELYRAVELVTSLNIVGLDMNELSPPLDASGCSTALACKLVREILLMLRRRRNG